MTNQGGPWGIVVDSQFVFWTNFNDDNVKKAPVLGTDGGAAQTVLLAQNQNNPTAIAIDEFNIYWASQGNQQIMKVAK